LLVYGDLDNGDIGHFLFRGASSNRCGGLRTGAARDFLARARRIQCAPSALGACAIAGNAGE